MTAVGARGAFPIAGTAFRPGNDPFPALGAMRTRGNERKRGARASFPAGNGLRATGNATGGGGNGRERGGMERKVWGMSSRGAVS
jgi:hypothetical protein